MENKEIKYESLPNNENIQIDNSYKKADQEFTNELARRNEYVPEPVVNMRIVSNIFSEICIICDSDIHSGSTGSNGIREEMKNNFIKNTANAYSVINGDIFNCVISCNQNVHDDQFGTNRQIERARQLYKDIADKIICVVDGNHDGAYGKRWVPTTLSPCKHLADAINVPNIEYGVNVEFNLPTSDNKREMKKINIYFAHAAGKSSGKANSVDVTFEQAMANLEDKGIVPDIIFGGHFHSNANGVYPYLSLQYDENGQCIGTARKDIVTVSESTLQEIASYALSMGLPKADSNVYINNIKLVKKPFSTNEYMVEFTRFPMFLKNKNEYTMQAIMYMRKHQEPTFLKDLVEKGYAKLSISESVEKLQEQNKKFVSGEFLDDGNEMLQN